MAVLTVPKILREKLSEDGADALVELLDKVESRAHDNTLETVEEKFEKRLAQVAGQLEVKIADIKADLLRWMFIFWIGQVGATLGILFAFFRSR